MFKLVIIILVIIVLVGIIEAKPKPIDGRIVGGRDANIENYPYQLAFMDEDEDENDGVYLACGAVLIHPKWALTTASCASGYADPSQITIRYDNTYLQKGESTKVSRIIRHPKYHSISDNNISILELVKPLTCKNCKPIPLTRANPRTGDNVTLTGWGDLQGMGFASASARLKVVSVPVYSFVDCKAYYKENGINLSDSMFCIGNKNGGQGFCFGDYGGPAVINDHLYGLMAFQEGCAKPGSPSGVTNVGKHVDWIEQVTGIRTN